MKVSETGDSIKLDERVDVVSDGIIDTLCGKYEHVHVKGRYGTTTYRKTRAKDMLK